MTFQVLKNTILALTNPFLVLDKSFQNISKTFMSIALEKGKRKCFIVILSIYSFRATSILIMGIRRKIEQQGSSMGKRRR